MKPLRLAAVATHPIQYQVPIFRLLASDPDVAFRAFFASRIGLDGSLDDEFGVKLAWDLPLDEGYPHTFLHNLTPVATTARFSGLDCPDIEDELRSGRFHAVLVPAYRSRFYLQAIRAALRARIPILYRPTITDLDVDDAPWKKLPRATFLSWLYRRISVFLAVGENARRHFLRHGVPEDRIVFSPHCVDNALYQRQAQHWMPRRDDTRRQLRFPPDRFVFLFSGKLSPRKDPLVLLRAAAVCRLRDRLGLLFLGDGPQRAELETTAASILPGRSAFVGFQNQSMIGKYYAASDCLVLPSLAGETWGLVVNDAMNFGLPAIVSDRVGCAPDVVREGHSGYTFPAGSAAALAARLDALLSSPSRACAMGAAARRLVASYSPEAAADGIRRALLLLYQGKPSRERHAAPVRC
ncbi:MAG: glycosyltransferase family 4 protein [Planctomycetota bacterium]